MMSTMFIAAGILAASSGTDIVSRATCADLASANQDYRLVVTLAAIPGVGSNAIAFICDKNYRCDSVVRQDEREKLGVKWTGANQAVIYTDATTDFAAVRRFPEGQRPSYRIAPLADAASGVTWLDTASCQTVPPVGTVR